METPQLEKEAENGNVDQLQDLSDHEREIIEQQLRVPEVAVSYGTLYRYANGRDILLLSIGSICAIGAGVVTPLMTVHPLSCLP
jgi:ATP-binding cassette subfamily B (MDR/TAP) protein 1